MRLPRSGISFSTEFEWVEAAVWAGYKLHEFRELEGEAQSEIVAAHRAHNQIEAVVANEQAKQMKRNAGKKNG